MKKGKQKDQRGVTREPFVNEPGHKGGSTGEMAHMVGAGGKYPLYENRVDSTAERDELQRARTSTGLIARRFEN